MAVARVHVVVHHQQAAFTLAEAEQVVALGADGVFLISHEGRDVELPPLVAELAARWHDARTRRDERPVLGMNLLKTQPLLALERAAGVGANALWVSTPGVTSAGVTADGQRLAEAMSRWPGIVVFGCVAFKYQPEEPDPPVAAAAALALGMHPTTSGAGTALAPNLSKIEAMSRAVGGRLAIASGMTPENVARYAPHVSDILVSTGVSRDAHHVDRLLLAAFLAEVARVPRNHTDG
jgi:predicted TIM-barrel enzyme